LNGLFQAYFWKVIFAYPESALSQFLIKSSKMEHFRDTLTEIFDSCINRSLTIGEIAEKMYMSESSVAHKCRNILGVSPGKAFMEYKMNKASGLILNTAMTFREISASLGFKNQFHFSKVFRSFYGYSPYEFRKNASGHKSSRMKKAT
jgi:AraC-like DNA-binding protein